MLRRRVTAPLVDLVADVERVLLLDVETAARPGPTGRAHLDAFAEVVADFSAGAASSGGTATVTALLAYLDAAEEAEDGLTPGEVDVADPATGGTRVQVLTVHAAKGLEWELVALPHVVEKVFPAGEAVGLVADVGRVAARAPARRPAGPPRARARRRRGPQGDPGAARRARAGLRRPPPRRGAAPVLRRAHPRRARAARVRALVGRDRRVAARPVGPPRRGRGAGRRGWRALRGRRGVGRAARGGRREPDGVGGPRDGLAGRPAGLAPGRGRRGRGAGPGGAARAARTPSRTSRRIRTTRRAGPPTSRSCSPSGRRRATGTRGCSCRRSCRSASSSTSPPTRTRWPGGCGARCRVPPIRGRGAAPSSTPGSSAGSPPPSCWSSTSSPARPTRTPTRPPTRRAPPTPPSCASASPPAAGPTARRWRWRCPFETEVAGTLVRGRIDAVFADDDGGATVVDWKTGRVPHDDALPALAVQLAAYRLAWSALSGIPVERVRAALHYVRDDVTKSPADLLDAAGLRALVAAVPGGAARPGGRSAGPVVRRPRRHRPGRRRGPGRGRGPRPPLIPSPGRPRSRIEA